MVSLKVFDKFDLPIAGPGCSSLGVGAFSENGPFRPNGQVLVRNEYSWNKGMIPKPKSSKPNLQFSSFSCARNKQKIRCFYVHSIVQKQICCT